MTRSLLRTSPRASRPHPEKTSAGRPIPPAPGHHANRAPPPPASRPARPLARPASPSPPGTRFAVGMASRGARSSPACTPLPPHLLPQHQPRFNGRPSLPQRRGRGPFTESVRAAASGRERARPCARHPGRGQREPCDAWGVGALARRPRSTANRDTAGMAPPARPTRARRRTPAASPGAGCARTAGFPRPGNTSSWCPSLTQATGAKHPQAG